MRLTALLAGACLMFAAHAHAQSPSNPLSTNDFVNKVADSDMFEIQSSEIALQKHPDRDTRPFASKMIKDHTKTSKQLKSLVSSGRVKAEVPTAIDLAQAGVAASLGESRKTINSLNTVEFALGQVLDDEAIDAHAGAR